MALIGEKMLNAATAKGRDVVNPCKPDAKLGFLGAWF
jgi:hypothetical protein